MSPGVPTVTLTHVFTKEGDQFVSYCMELGTSSCGDTIEEAFDNIKEAVEVHLNALEQMGEMERVFRERGITVHYSPREDSHAQLSGPVNTVMAATDHRVPAFAL